MTAPWSLEVAKRGDDMETIDSKNLDPQFKYDVAAHPGGENLKLCFACGTCTAGCPVSEVDPEFNPRKIIRQVMLGAREEVLSAPVIWRCVQCYSCTAKCPQNVKFREVMKALREMAVAEGHADASVLQEVEELGRLSQKLRRDMAQALVTKQTAYKKLKRGVEALTA
jgi:heterodisulfide reductase subunit C